MCNKKVHGYERKDSRLERAGVSGYNKPKRTPDHPTKSHIVVAKQGDTVKTIRFGEQGTQGSPKKEGESEEYRKRREALKLAIKRTLIRGHCLLRIGQIRLNGNDSIL